MADRTYQVEFLSDVSQEHKKVLRPNTLHDLGEAAVRGVQQEIRRRSFRRPATDLINSFDFEIDDQTHRILIYSDHPAAEYLENGVRSHHMTYLEEAGPVPILTDMGELIFRTPPENVHESDGWEHPGIEGKHFIEAGLERARENVMDELREIFRQRIPGQLTNLD